MLTRAEKEKLVIQLYEQGKNVREISKMAHMSFGSMDEIIRKHSGEEKVKDQKPLFKNTLALKLFYEDKSPIQVVIELDVLPLDVKELYE